MNQTNFARKVREGWWFMLAFWLDRGSNQQMLGLWICMDLLPLHFWDLLGRLEAGEQCRTQANDQKA